VASRKRRARLGSPYVLRSCRRSRVSIPNLDSKPEPVARGVRQILPHTQVALGGLDAGVAETQLNLLKRGLALVGQLGEGAPQVRVWRTVSKIACAVTSGWSWFRENWALGAGIFFGFLLWILFVGLVAMASSALVGWRIVAGALVLGFFFVLAGAAELANAV